MVYRVYAIYNLKTGRASGFSTYTALAPHAGIGGGRVVSIVSRATPIVKDGGGRIFF